MNKVIDNSEIFLKKPYKPFDGLPIKQTRPGRRVISPGLGGRRKFAGVIRGEDVLRPLGEGSSFSVNLGASLPSMQQLADRERAEDLQKRFLEGIVDKSKLPKKDEGRFKI